MRLGRSGRVACLLAVVALASGTIAPPGGGTANAAGTAPSCFGKPATIVGQGTVKGTARADVIVGGPGDDRIVGGGGNDRICAGGGDDLIEAGIGSDRVEAGGGDDHVIGGNGSDEVHGGAGRDSILGKRGNDHLDGGPGARDFLDAGLGDDTLDGGPGEADQVIGGLGNDHLDGGEGDYDLLRPDFGRDTVDGGPGLHDAVSFAVSGRNVTRSNGGEQLPGGVIVNLAAGTAEGDGEDTLAGVEDVIGTGFGDTISGDAEPNVLYGGGGIDELRAVGPGDSADGGSGLDRCPGVEAATSCELSGELPYSAENEARAVEAQGAGGVLVERPPKLEVDLAGGPSAGALTAIVNNPYHYGYLTAGAGVEVVVSFAEGAFLVATRGIAVEPGDGCQELAAELARCPLGGVPEAVLISGTEAADVLRIDPSVPATVSAFISGGNGTDTIEGGAGDDVLDGYSELGDDVIRGGPGDDSLTTGAVLEGGPGSDLLIAFPCDGEQLDGGAGIDSVSFARSGGVIAEIGGFATYNAGSEENGESLGPGCAQNGYDFGSAETVIDDSVESLEGSSDDDVLIGDGARNILLGRGGDDVVRGAGGDDFLVGGLGADRLFGEGGADRLYAREGAPDAALDCGPEAPGNVALVDPGDPPARHCRVLKRG